MSDLLERLEARAPQHIGPVFHHTLNYNYPLQWYRRPDGDIVQLQSDPNNRAMYEDLGFVLLRPDEAQEWEDEVRPEVIAGQKKRAQLITVIRQQAARNPQVMLTDEESLSFSEWTLEELQQRFDEICEQLGHKPRMPRIPPEKTVAEPALVGVEVNRMHTQEELAGKLQRGQGYDPTKEARRR